MGALRAALEQGSTALGLALSSAQLDSLLRYLELLQKWGNVYNLTAVRDPRRMLTHHLLDSLAIIVPLQRELARTEKSPGPRLLDVGSGAGLPGVVVAICCPAIAVSCIDTVAKKAAFVQQVAVELKLRNLLAVHARVENLAEQYDVVVSRAFASLAEFTRLSAHAPVDGGTWLAMKGKLSQVELGELPAEIEVFHVEQALVPGLDAQRCLVWMRRRYVI